MRPSAAAELFAVLNLTFCGVIRLLLENEALSLAQGILVSGSIGSGKSTLGRVIGTLRDLAPQRAETRRRFLEAIRWDGPVRIDKKCIDWHEAINLSRPGPSRSLIHRLSAAGSSLLR